MRIRHPKVPKGTAIGVRESARKYGVHHSVIVVWAKQDGASAIVKSPAFRGDSTLIDEAWLQGRLRDYEPHEDNKQRRVKGRTLPQMQEAAPRHVEGLRQPAAANGSTGLTTSGNGHANGQAVGSRLARVHTLTAPVHQGTVSATAPIIRRNRTDVPVLSTREWVERFYTEKLRSFGGAMRTKTKESYDWAFGCLGREGVNGTYVVLPPYTQGRFMALYITLPMDRHTVMEYLHGLKKFVRGRGGIMVPTNEPLSPGSKKLAHRVISTFYAWLGREHGYKDKVPDLSHTNLPAGNAEKATFAQEEIRLLLANAKNHEEYTIIVVMAQVGCRRGELCSLTLENLHARKGGGGWAHCWGKPTRANPEGKRVLYIAEEAYEALERHLRLFRRMMLGGQPLTEERVDSLIRNLQLQVRIYEPGKNSHAFRRAYEAEFLRNGGSELVMDELLGHRKVDMRSLYFNMPREDALEQAIKYAPRRFLREGEIVRPQEEPAVPA